MEESLASKGRIRGEGFGEEGGLHGRCSNNDGTLQVQVPIYPGLNAFQLDSLL